MAKQRVGQGVFIMRLFKDQDGEPRIYSFGARERPRGYRWHLYWPGNNLNIQAHFLSRRCALTATFDDTDDEDVHVHIAIPFVINLYLSLGNCQWLMKLLGLTWKQVRDKGSWYWRREIGFSVFDKALWIYPWINPHEGGSVYPRNDIVIRPDRILFGCERCTHTAISKEDAIVIMPEGRYRATVKFSIYEWKRPRWPFAKKAFHADIEVEGGIPIPGKGENSWDMDDDAIFSIGMRGVRTAAEACRKFYDSVMRDRIRHAAADWRPDDGWPTHCLQGTEAEG